MPRALHLPQREQQGRPGPTAQSLGRVVRAGRRATRASHGQAAWRRRRYRPSRLIPQAAFGQP
eukprot:11226960-Lingulodinium_polyedra.AAC.1